MRGDGVKDMPGHVPGCENDPVLDLGGGHGRVPAVIHGYYL